MEKNIMEKLASRARVKVTKPYPGSDDRRKLEGEPMQVGKNAEGEEEHFFILSAHRADYINRAFRKYSVSEPFIPGVDDISKLQNQEKPEPETFTCTVEGCGRSFKTQAALDKHMTAHD